MQKLSAKLKNVPVDIPHVYCSTNLTLNKEETLSVLGGLKDVKLTDNNLDAALTCLVVQGQVLTSTYRKNYQPPIFRIIDFPPRNKFSGFQVKGEEDYERTGGKMTPGEKWIELWAAVYDYNAQQHCKSDVAIQEYGYSYRDGFNDALDWVIGQMNSMDGEEDQQKS